MWKNILTKVKNNDKALKLSMAVVYDSIELALPVLSLEGELPGILTVPRGKGPFPAVVLIHGFGSYDKDEAPFAYKSIDEIMEYIVPTVQIIKVIKPVYNFKASDVFIWKSDRIYKYSCECLH